MFDKEQVFVISIKTSGIHQTFYADSVCYQVKRPITSWVGNCFRNTMYYIQKSKFNLQTAFSSEHELTKHSRCIISLFREPGPIYTDRKRKRSKNRPINQRTNGKHQSNFSLSLGLNTALLFKCSQRALQISIAHFYFRNMTMQISTKSNKVNSPVFSEEPLLLTTDVIYTEFWIHFQLDFIILPR